MAKPVDSSVSHSWLNEPAGSEYLSKVRDGLEVKRAVVVVGSAGSGKTTLSQEIADEMPVILADEFQDLEKANETLSSELAKLYESGSAVLVTARFVSPGLQAFIDEVKPDVVTLTR